MGAVQHKISDTIHFRERRAAARGAEKCIPSRFSPEAWHRKAVSIYRRRMKVETGTQADLDEVLRWLKDEYDETGSSFWVNRGAITQSLEYDSFFVIREGGDAVAFQMGRYSPSIVAVQPDRRGRGYGRAFAEWTIEDARTNGVCVLAIECQPPTSIPFWKRMGFQMVKETEATEWVGGDARLVINKEFDLPKGPKVDVMIEFYPDGAQHTGSNEAALSEHRPRAVRSEDGQILLAYRVMGLHEGRDTNDIVIKIAIDGEVLCFDRAKYVSHFGVQRDRHSGTYYVDAIDPAAVDED